MEFMALVYDDPAGWERMTEAEQASAMEGYMAVAEEATAAGALVSGAGLAPTTAARSVRVRNGEALVTDGPYTEVKESLFSDRVRLIAPVIMGAACVSCHNSHVESVKKDWKVGDVRGLQEVSITQPFADNLFSFKYLLIYFALLAVTGRRAFWPFIPRLGTHGTDATHGRWRRIADWVGRGPPLRRASAATGRADARHPTPASISRPAPSSAPAACTSSRARRRRR